MKSIATLARLTHVLTACGLICLLLLSCNKKENSNPGTQNQAPAQPVTTSPNSDTPGTTPIAPLSESYYVLDPRSNTIFGIDLNSNAVVKRLVRPDKIVAIQYDESRNWVYEALDDPNAGLDIYDATRDKYVQKLRFPGAPAALLYHPVQQKVFLVSEDSTNLRVFDPDSVKITLSIPLTIQNREPIAPFTLNPGPAGKIISANSANPSVTQILTANKYLMQTVIINTAEHINSAVFSYDGNSSFCCDTKLGAVYRVEFGTGKIMAEKHQVDKPRMLQIEVTSNTVVAVTGEAELLMMNPETLRETGHVDLSQYGESILSFVIPPKANYAELLMDYKGVTRWVRFDIQNWQPTRLVELI